MDTPEVQDLYEENNFPSPKDFYQILKDAGIATTHQKIKEFVSKQAVYQINTKRTKIKSQMRFATARHPYEILQIDLTDYSKYSTTNKGNTFLFMAVDVFSRQAWAIPLKNKSAEDVLASFQHFFSALVTEKKIKVVFHDAGNEYMGSFKKYIDDNKIVDMSIIATGNHLTFGIVDRFTRTIRSAIQKHFTAKNTTNYIDAIDKILKLYNHHNHRGIDGIKPANAMQPENIKKIEEINMEKEEYNQDVKERVLDKIPTLNVGDYVRVFKENAIFQKGFEKGYSEKVFKIINIIGSFAYTNDSKKHQLNKLMQIPDYTEAKFLAQPAMSALERNSTANQNKRRLKRAGLA